MSVSRRSSIFFSSPTLCRRLAGLTQSPSPTSHLVDEGHHLTETTSYSVYHPSSELLIVARHYNLHRIFGRFQVGMRSAGPLLVSWFNVSFPGTHRSHTTLQTYIELAPLTTARHTCQDISPHGTCSLPAPALCLLIRIQFWSC